VILGLTRGLGCLTSRHQHSKSACLDAGMTIIDPGMRWGWRCYSLPLPAMDKLVMASQGTASEERGDTKPCSGYLIPHDQTGGDLKDKPPS